MSTPSESASPGAAAPAARRRGQPRGGPAAAIEELRGELQGWFDMSPLGQVVFDEAGNVLRHNAALAQLLGPLPGQLRETAPEFQLLLGWPGELPAVAATRTQDGWLGNADGEPLRVRVRVRGVPANGGGRAPGAATTRWIAMLEDRNLEDERDIARVEIQALMGTAGIGVATWDAARGWVGSVQRGARAGAPGRQRRRDGDRRERQGSLMAVGRDLVEAESMAEYERLQAALRTRSRIEVRYAVRHHESGRRWLMTRVEPAELGPAARRVLGRDGRRHRGGDGAPPQPGPAHRAHDHPRRQPRRHRLPARRGARPLQPPVRDAAGRQRLSGGQALRRDPRQRRRAGRDRGRADRRGARRRHAGDRAAAAGGHASQDAIWCTLALRRTHETAPGAIGMVVVLADATRMKSQQSELEALARERELMFNLSDVGIVYQRDGQIERANQAMADLVGYAPEASKGSPMSRLYESEAAWQHYLHLETRDMATLGRSHGERQVRRRDGSLFWAQVSQRPVAVGKPSAGTIMSFVNIDDRQRARESLVQQADRTRAILDSVLVGIVTVGDTGIEWMNRSARRMFGGELADFIGAPISVVAGDELDHPLRRTDYGETLEEGQAETFECRLRARDGRHFWVVGNVVVTGQDTAQPPAHLRAAGHRAPPPGRGQHRAGARQPAAHHRDRAAGHRAVRRRQPAGGAAEPDGRDVRGPADEGDPRPRARRSGCPAPRARSCRPTCTARWPRRAACSASCAAPRTTAPGEDGEGAHSVWDIRIVSLRSAADAPDQLLMVASDVTAQRAADEARLAAAIAQREMLIKEVHHRIKNNLQGVAGLLQQSASRHPEAAGAIAEAVSQVHAIAQVHGLQVGVTGPMRVRGVVEAIAASVQRMFGRTIHVEVQRPGAAPLRADRGRLDPDRADRQRAVHQRDQAQRAGRRRAGHRHPLPHRLRRDDGADRHRQPGPAGAGLLAGGHPGGRIRARAGAVAAAAQGREDGDRGGGRQRGRAAGTGAAGGDGARAALAGSPSKTPRGRTWGRRPDAPPGPVFGDPR